MSFEIILTPAGCLRLVCPESERAAEAPGTDSEELKYGSWMQKVAAGFRESSAAGLFRLAASKPDLPLTAPVLYWRKFAEGYLTELCRRPETAAEQLEPVEPPPEAERQMLALSAPPMPGAEYLNEAVLANLWVALDSWVRQEVEAGEAGLSGWLKEQAPLWHQVGRVCFHLAENKGDPEYPFAFLATYAPQLSAGGKIQYQPLGRALREYAGENNKKALLKLLTPVYRASESSSIVRDLVESGDIYHPLAWTPADAYKFLKDIALLEESGILVRIPNWWRKRPRPRVAVTVGEKAKSHFGADAMLDFKVSLALGDQALTEEEVRQIMEAQEGLVYLRGQWVEVDREKLSAVLEHWQQLENKASGGGISFIEAMRLLAGAPPDLSEQGKAMEDNRRWSFVKAGPWLAEMLEQLQTARERPFSGNNGFNGTLRPYQETGHNWLHFLSGLGLGACLADDMGLGKTIQVIALLLTRKNSTGAENSDPGAGKKASLLVLPASLLANWKAEIERFAPTLKVLYFHPAETGRDEMEKIAKNPQECLTDTDLVITTYGMLLRQKWLQELAWQLVILDEAQAIKNPASRQTVAVKKLQAEARIALTGTPLENRLTDLWSLFDFLCPGLLGSQKKFKTFIKSLEERESDRYAPLRNLVNPYILRRLKTDRKIISDLPDKTEVKVYCGLTRKQAALYARTVEEMKLALSEAKGIKRRGLVLSYLMRFKQICNHPGQALGNGVYEPAASGKFNRLQAICEEIASRQEKVLIFTQFREMTGPIASFLEEVFGCGGLIMHGGTSVKKRQGLVESFGIDQGPPFFVLSLKAGGTGLNLTAASHVVHFDRWWNPAVENQATDRAYRIGQHRNVLVHKFVCRGTIEEKIDLLIDDKKELADDILKGGPEKMLTEMNDRELIRMVSLDLERASL
ncbi:MAG: DEAD/DEAH box helicase [Bacillota bacterium]|nr:DEAD/DEAH box helicase [Bacillota bacterium]